MTYLTTFTNKNILRESTFNRAKTKLSSNALKGSAVDMNLKIFCLNSGALVKWLE